jgi:hypothetical protein
MVRLMGSRNRLDAAGTERLEALRNRAAGAFLRSDKGEALPEDERRMVVEALRGALPEGSEALLLPALSRSLEPDPLSRLPSASSLRRACQELHDRLAAATGAPAWAPPVVPVFVPQGPSLGREGKGGDTWDGGTLAPGSTDGTDGTLGTGGRSGPPSRGREGVSPGGPPTTGGARRTTGSPEGEGA